MYYVQHGSVPRQRHTQHRAPDGSLVLPAYRTFQQGPADLIRNRVNAYQFRHRPKQLLHLLDACRVLVGLGPGLLQADHVDVLAPQPREGALARGRADAVEVQGQDAHRDMIARCRNAN